jgi:hypothetical protein
MAKTIQSPIATSAEDGPAPARDNPRVAHCCNVFERAFLAAAGTGLSEYGMKDRASQAYRNAMPPLTGYQNCCDFVACVAHGILIEAIPEALGTKLLYAAQVALSNVRQQPKPQPSATGAPAPKPLANQAPPASEAPSAPQAQPQATQLAAAS